MPSRPSSASSPLCISFSGDGAPSLLTPTSVHPPSAMRRMAYAADLAVMELMDLKDLLLRNMDRRMTLMEELQNGTSLDDPVVVRANM